MSKTQTKLLKKFTTPSTPVFFNSVVSFEYEASVREDPLTKSNFLDTKFTISSWAYTNGDGHQDLVFYATSAEEIRDLSKRLRKLAHQVAEFEKSVETVGLLSEDS